MPSPRPADTSTRSGPPRIGATTATDVASCGVPGDPTTRWRNWTQLRTLLRFVAAAEALALLGGGAMVLADKMDERRERDEALALAADAAPTPPPSTEPPPVIVQAVAGAVCSGTGVEAFGQRALDGTPRRPWFEGAPGLVNGIPDGQHVEAVNFDTVVCTTSAATSGETCNYGSPWGGPYAPVEFTLTMTGQTVTGTVRDARTALEVGRFELEFEAEDCPERAERTTDTATDVDWSMVHSAAMPYMTK